MLYIHPSQCGSSKPHLIPGRRAWAHPLHMKSQFSSCPFFWEILVNIEIWWVRWHTFSTHRKQMVGHPSAYWARRKGGEAIQLMEGDKQELVLAYQRSGSVRAAAKERRVHRRTVQKGSAFTSQLAAPNPQHAATAGGPKLPQHQLLLQRS